MSKKRATQEIIGSLEKRSSDFTHQIKERCKETHGWLENELELIRKLMQQNPRDYLTRDSKTQNDLTVHADTATQVELAVEPAAKPAEKQQDNSKKRKSPETALSSSNLSPEQKRLSVDIDEVLKQSNLPSNLNNMKKEQLLAELKKRGDSVQIMKDTKAVLISALKEIVLKQYNAEHQIKSKSAETAAADDMDVSIKEVQPTTLFTTNPPVTEPQATSMVALLTPSKSYRKGGSMMSDFRNIVNSEPVTATVLPEKQAQEEFRARQNRHRDSQARKSQILEAIKMSEVESGSTTLPTSDSSAAQNDGATVEQIVEQPIKLSLLEVNVVDNSANDADAMVLASPTPASRSSAAQVVHSAEKMAQDDEENDETNQQEEGEVVESDAEDEVAAEPEEQDEMVAEVESEMEEVSLESDAADDVTAESDLASDAKDAAAEVVLPLEYQSEQEEEPEEEQEEVAEAAEQNTEQEQATQQNAEMVSEADSELPTPVTEITQSVPEATIAAPGPVVVAPVVPLVKKPLNLITAPAPKSNVAALEKAKQLKAAEELKKEQAAAKKREQEAKIASNKLTVSNNAASALAAKNAAQSAADKTKVVPKVVVSKPTTTPKESAVSAPATTNSTTAPATGSSFVKNAAGRLFGGIMGAKKTPTTPVAPSSAASSLNSSSGSSKSSFDVSVVDAKAPVSAAPQSTKPSFDVGFTSASKPADAPKTTSVPAPAPMTTPAKEKAPIAFDKNKISTILSNYQNAVTHSTPAKSSPPPIVDLHKAAAVALGKPMQPAVVSPPPVKAPVTNHSSNTNSSNAVLKDITAKVAQATPGAQQSAKKPHQEECSEYQIEDRPSSDEEGGEASGTDDEEENKKKQQMVPEWARGAKLKEALEKQYGLNGHTPMDPDLIFHEVQTCSLEEIFGTRDNKKYSKRSSSAHWDADQLTLVEKRTYRNHMGYDSVNRLATHTATNKA